MKTIIGILLTAAVGLAIWGCVSDYLPPHTWVDDVVPAVVDPFAKESNVTPPPEFSNADRMARLVDDLVTGEQVFVINKGWRHHNQIVYRILRRVQVKVAGLNKRGYFWSVETRNLNELQPIPSV